MTTKKNSLFKIKSTNEEKQFTVNDFIDLFLKDGPFESFLQQIFGIVTHNFLLNIYNVTFNDGITHCLLALSTYLNQSQ